jgi:serine/threonine protein phosphatase 1
MGRLFAVGDIHGCADALTALLNRIKPDRDNDRVIFLGDYINRGKDSRRVIDILLEFKKKYPRTIFLKGNHEVMFMSYLEGADEHLFLQSGGIKTLESYGIEPTGQPWIRNMDNDIRRRKIPTPHWRFLCGLFPYWEEEGYIFVHAGFEKGRHPAMQRPEWLYWAEKEKFMGQAFERSHKKIVFGHFVHDSVTVMEDKIGIDLGAVYGGELACLILPAMEVVKVRCA